MKYCFYTKSIFHEKMIFTCDCSFVKISNNKKFWKNLNNGKLSSFSISRTINNLNKCINVHISIGKESKITFIFNKTRSLNRLFFEIANLKTKGGPLESDFSSKINSVLSICSKYNPLFCYCLLSSNIAQQLGEYTFSFPFLLFISNENSNATQKSEVRKNRIFTSCYYLFVSAVCVNSFAFLLTLIRNKSEYVPLFAALLVVCFIMFVAGLYFNNKDFSSKKFFQKWDVLFFISSIVGVVIGTAVFYFLLKYTVKIYNQSLFVTDIFISVISTLGIVVVSKAISYLINIKNNIRR